ncbi:MAG: hypothetical protein ABI867_39255 [Kofleriaceae bacterium]
MMRALALVIPLASACLGPQVDDGVTRPTELLPAGSTVTSALADPEIAARVDANDGVDGRIVRQTAFVAGRVVHVWDFGPAPEIAAPLFVIVERDPSGNLVRTPHDTIIDAIPGDPGYSPFWAAFFIEITDAYDGELMTSFSAVAEAVDRGLVLAPVAQPFAVNCPAVGLGVELEVGDGQATPPATSFYYHGTSVPYFDFGMMPLDGGVRVPEAPRYLLRREGAEPLSEVVRHVDMDGDGDARDTNDVYAIDPAAFTSTPRLRSVEVVVRSTVASIDTSQDETIADLRDAVQLFTPAPGPAVVSYEALPVIHNIAGQHVTGGL